MSVSSKSASLRLFKLISGDEIIGVVEATGRSNNSVHVNRPVRVMMVQVNGEMSFGLSPFLTTDIDPYLHIRDEKIVYETEPNQTLAHVYMSRLKSHATALEFMNQPEEVKAMAVQAALDLSLNPHWQVH